MSVDRLVRLSATIAESESDCHSDEECKAFMNQLLPAARILLLCCSVAASAPASGQRARPKPPAPSPEAGKLRDEFIKQDIRLHDNLPRGFTEPYQNWTDDYTEIDETGEVLSKAEVRARYHASANRRPNIPPEDYAIRLHQGTAIMTHVLKRSGLKNDKDGYPVIPTVYSFRVTHVFVKRDGAWQMTSTQWTPIVPARAE